MRWFRRRQPEPPSAMDQAEPEPEVHPSPGLETLLDELPTRDRLRIVDLGPALGDNLDFFSSRFSCRVQVADLYRSVQAEERHLSKERIADLLPLPDPPDLILAWDLPSYLPREALKALLAHLSAGSAAGTRLFTMVASHSQMPNEPTTFVLREPAALEYRLRSRARRPAPRLPPAELAALAPRFKVDRSFLLRHGYQEYVMIRQE
ncbi:MAG: hypothetical protein AAF481_16715 [Acidobacteriota bacterium]